MKVTHHVCYIQDKPAEFYKQFSVIIGGLDNLVARRWVLPLVTMIDRRSNSCGALKTRSVSPLPCLPAAYLTRFSVSVDASMRLCRWMNSLLCSFVEVDDDGAPVDPSQVRSTTMCD